MNIFISRSAYTSMTSSTVVAIGPTISTVPLPHNDLQRKGSKYDFQSLMLEKLLL